MSMIGGKPWIDTHNRKQREEHPLIARAQWFRNGWLKIRNAISDRLDIGSVRIAMPKTVTNSASEKVKRCLSRLSEDFNEGFRRKAALQEISRLTSSEGRWDSAVKDLDLKAEYFANQLQQVRKNSELLLKEQDLSVDQKKFLEAVFVRTDSFLVKEKGYDHVGPPPPAHVPLASDEDDVPLASDEDDEFVDIDLNGKSQTDDAQSELSVKDFVLVSSDGDDAQSELFGSVHDDADDAQSELPEAPPDVLPDQKVPEEPEASVAKIGSQGRARSTTSAPGPQTALVVKQVVRQRLYTPQSQPTPRPSASGNPAQQNVSSDGQRPLTRQSQAGQEIKTSDSARRPVENKPRNDLDENVDALMNALDVADALDKADEFLDKFDEYIVGEDHKDDRRAQGKVELQALSTPARMLDRKDVAPAQAATEATGTENLTAQQRQERSQLLTDQLFALLAQGRLPVLKGAFEVVNRLADPLLAPYRKESLSNAFKKKAPRDLALQQFNRAVEVLRSDPESVPPEKRARSALIVEEWDSLVAANGSLKRTVESIPQGLRFEVREQIGRADLALRTTAQRISS